MPARKSKNRIVLTHSEKPSPEFWDSHWSLNEDLRKKIDDAANGLSLVSYEKVLSKYLPTNGKILEAGCGYGPIVFGLKSRGYNIEGLENSRKLVEKILEIVPEAPIQFGDVTEIKRPANFYDAYLSFGVMEHDLEGPSRFLKEAHRVLKPGGIAIIYVPFYDLFWKIRSLFLKKWDNNETFFQWHFTRAEFLTFIKKEGFEIIAMGGNGVRTGLIRAFPFADKIFKLKGGYRLWKFLSFLEDHPLTSSFGWMQYFVCRKVCEDQTGKISL